MRRDFFIVDGFNLGEPAGKSIPSVVGNVTELDSRQLLNIIQTNLPQVKARGIVIDSINDLLTNVDIGQALPFMAGLPHYVGI
ncbi:MAG: hypothetical protein RXQ97_00520 [Caldivirga sp.]